MGNIRTIKRLGLSTEQEQKVWLDLGAKDLSRITAEHEKELYTYLKSQGAIEGLLYRDDEAVLRCLFYPLDLSGGVFSMGFFAVSDPKLYSELQADFQELFDTLVCKHGLREVIGPLNGLTWFPYRIRTDSHPVHYAWEPPRQKELEDFLLGLAFKPLAHYHSVCTDGLSKYILETERDYQAVCQRGFEIEDLLPGSLSLKDIQELYHLASDGFSDNFLFHPISFEAFYKIYLYGKSDQPTFLSVIRDGSGQMIAFAMAFVQDQQLVYKTATTHRSYRRQGMSNALFHAIGKKHAQGLSQRYISALVFKGLTSESYAAHGSEQWRHQYVLLKRSF